MADPLGQISDALTVGRFRLGSLVARITPSIVARGTISAVAPAIAVLQRDKRLMVERHQKRVDPALGGLALNRRVSEAFDSYMRYYAESFKLPSMSRRYVDRCFTVDGWHHVEAALETGNGAIFALPHLGGWEWAGRWMADRGHHMTVIVEPLEPPEMFEIFRRLRSDLGMNVVPLGPDAVPAILAALKRNELVCLLSDRDIQGGGIEVDFFGERTTLPAGPVMLALRANSTVLPVAVYFTDSIDGHHTVVRPPLQIDRSARLREAVTKGTQDLARELEGLIRRAPEQWHLFQPNWPSDPGWSDLPGR